MNRLLSIVLFLAGLAAVGWVASTYSASHPLALAVTLAIGAFYLMGVLELRQYQQATEGLAHAVSSLPDAPPALGAWLDTLPATLRNTVRLRVEGERVGLPGPALTPYLAGFLVLLGMLGTFVGMVVTLRGTGLALETATDLAAVRASLAAPVKGLGVAFGTSLAGIATSAMLGLLSALARRERLQAGQLLDSRIATTLRVFSPAHQRDESFRLLQRQTEALPAIAERLQAMAASLEQQHQALHERLLAGQDRFHTQAETRYTGLADAVGASLKTSLAESARLAGAAIQPAVETAMAGIAREASALHGQVATRVQQQLDGQAERFEAATTAAARHWSHALAEQRRSNDALATGLQATLAGFADTFGERSATLVQNVATQLADTTGRLSHAWQAVLAEHGEASRTLAATTQQTLAATATQFEAQAAALLHTAEQAHAALHTQTAARDDQRLGAWTSALARHEEATQALATDTQQALTAAAAQFAQHAAALQEGVHQAHAELQVQATARDDARQAAWSHALAQQEAANLALTTRTQQALAEAAERFAEHAAALQHGVAQAHAALQADAATRDAQRMAAWAETLAAHAQTNQALATTTQQALAGTAAEFTQHAATLQQTVDRAHADLQERIAARDADRLAAWTGALDSMATSLRTEWQATSAQAAQQQQGICTALSETARQITTQTEAQARSTIAEIGRVLHAAAEAPRAAAEVIGELRDKLSDSMARDNAMLDERARVLETLATLLDAVNHASTEQRSAIDALVGTSAELLERVGHRFTERVDSESARMADTAAQIGASAAEVAALGETFGQAVQAFGQTSEQLGGHLQKLDDTLLQSIARSDDQLAYYVAQAREVIDLSMHVAEADRRRPAAPGRAA
jgi:hypothetical protein